MSVWLNQLLVTHFASSEVQPSLKGKVDANLAEPSRHFMKNLYSLCCLLTGAVLSIMNLFCEFDSSVKFLQFANVEQIHFRLCLSNRVRYIFHSVLLAKYAVMLFSLHIMGVNPLTVKQYIMKKPRIWNELICFWLRLKLQLLIGR